MFKELKFALLRKKKSCFSPTQAQWFSNEGGGLRIVMDNVQNEGAFFFRKAFQRRSIYNKINLKEDFFTQHFLKLILPQVCQYFDNLNRYIKKKRKKG